MIHGSIARILPAEFAQNMQARTILHLTLYDVGETSVAPPPSAAWPAGAPALHTYIVMESISTTPAVIDVHQRSFASLRMTWFQPLRGARGITGHSIRKFGPRPKSGSGLNQVVPTS